MQYQPLWLACQAIYARALPDGRKATLELA